MVTVALIVALGLTGRALAADAEPTRACPRKTRWEILPNQTESRGAKPSPASRLKRLRASNRNIAIRACSTTNALAVLRSDFDRAEQLLTAARRNSGSDGEVRFCATYNLGWVEVLRATSSSKRTLNKRWSTCGRPPTGSRTPFACGPRVSKRGTIWRSCCGGSWSWPTRSARKKSET